MARPTRCRRICFEPAYDSFAPDGISSGEKIILTLDEYEVIRLIDLEKLTHLECAKQMEISRTTVTEIYETARCKIADSIVNGKELVISGGNYRICSETPANCRRNCCKHQGKITRFIQQKGDNTMRIAVTYANGNIFQHFGHSSQFKIYDIENNEIVNQQVIDTNGQGHGALATLLNGNQVDVLICGGIGGGAQNALAQAGIKLFGGVTGSADEAVKAYLAGTLEYTANVTCNHHDHQHSCGQHQCSEDKHGCSGNN